MKTPELDSVREAVLKEIRSIVAVIEPDSEIKAHLNTIWVLVDDHMYWAAEADYGTSEIK